MTVTYTAQVATCTGLGCFWKLLFRWHGSIYKLLWPNLVVYSIVYFGLSVIYRFSLSDDYRVMFEKISLHCQAYGDLIPIAFVLGFYVSIVIKRWWDQYICIPWPDNLAMFVSTLVHGQDDRGRLMRRTIIRYVNLCLVITFRMISPQVKKRFPTMDHLVEAGFLHLNEKKIFEDLDLKTSHPKYWMPLVWAGGIITRARKEGRINDDFSLKTLIDELNIFRSGCGGMLNYDWISIPLVYTQVVTLAVYTYFMATLMGNQFLDPEKGYPKHEVDLVFPVFTFLQFFFYMGWLKVAESLVNPFGEDDDDFELNWLVDRNLQVSYVIVDEMHQEHPEMVKDQYWDEVFPAELPYTVASKLYQTGPPPGSADNVEVSLEQAEFIPLETVAEEAQEEVDNFGDIELDVEDPERGGTRRETHPMKIIARQKTDSSGSINTSSYSGPRGGRKSSILNMLTRLFRREGSSHDLTGSNMGSSISIPSRHGQRCSSRMSSMSQAQSRTSIPRINTFQDEVFHMSDVSLAGSAFTTESPIQIAVPRGSDTRQQIAATEEDKEFGEATQLISWSNKKDNSRQICKDRLNEGEDLKTIETEIDDTSEGSGNSVQTSFFQESWGTSTDPSGSAMYLSPQQNVPEVLVQKTGRSETSEGKDEGATSSLVTFIDPHIRTESVSTTTQIVIPSSAPIRHLFTPLTDRSTQTQKGVKKIQSNIKDEMFQMSTLSRSLQQQYSENEVSKNLIPIAFQGIDAVANMKCTLISSDPKLSTNTEALITMLSSAAPEEILAASPLVSLPSALVPTTSIVTTSFLATSAGTVSSPALTIPLCCTTLTAKPPEVPCSGSESSPSSSSKKPLLPQTTSVTVALESIDLEDETLKQPNSPLLGGPSQYVPSAAIPVPSVSPAHATSSSSNMELIEAAMAPLARRTYHDFHELEPISEHGETTTDSPLANINHKQKDKQHGSELGGHGPESTV